MTTAEFTCSLKSCHYTNTLRTYCIGPLSLTKLGSYLSEGSYKLKERIQLENMLLKTVEEIPSYYQLMIPTLMLHSKLVNREIMNEE